MAPESSRDPPSTYTSGGEPWWDDPQRVWHDWPCCPDCGRRRRVECPACGVSGTHIPLADTWEDAEPLRPTRDVSNARAGDKSRAPAAAVLLLCPCCDEPYRPRYFRYCEWCGHDFGAGIEHTGDPSPISRRVVWTAAGLIGVVVGLLCWFSYVLNG